MGGITEVEEGGGCFSESICFSCPFGVRQINLTVTPPYRLNEGEEKKEGRERGRSLIYYGKSGLSPRLKVFLGQRAASVGFTLVYS